MNSEIAEIHKLVVSLVEDQRTVLDAVSDAEKYLSDSISEENIVDKILAESPNNFAIRTNPISPEEIKYLFLEKHQQLLEGARQKGQEPDSQQIEKLLSDIELRFKTQLINKGCNPEDFVQLDLEITRVLLSPKSLNAIYQSLYILTFANFEAFLHQITKCSISANDLILMGTTSKTFNWSEIRDDGAVSKIRETLIDEAADKLMHQSMQNWLDWYEQKINLKVDKQFRFKCETLYKLRNIFAHEKSSHSMYLNVATKDLVRDAADLLLFFAFQITISLVQKNKDQIQLDEYLSRLSDTTVKLLQRGRNKVVIDLSSYIIEFKIDADWMDLYKVNNWIARKALNGQESVNAEIESWDVSEKKPVYQLAKYSLLDQKEKATELFNRLESEGKLSKLEWETWPLFNTVK